LEQPPADVLGHRLFVHGDRAGAARLQPDFRDGVLPFPRSVIARFGQWSSPQKLYGSGPWASCGCVAPLYTFSFRYICAPRALCGSMPLIVRSISCSGDFSSILPREIDFRPPGYPECQWISSSFLFPVSFTRSALMMMI